MAPIAILRATLAVVALLANGVLAASGDAQAVLDSYIATHPISTRSNSQSKAAVDLTSVKNSVLAENYASRPWQISRAPCPESCTSLGLNASTWPVYTSVNRLDQCDEAMLLSFSLYNQIDTPDSIMSIRGCAADLSISSATTQKTKCVNPVNSTTFTASLEMARESTQGTGSANDAVLALKQLLAYENLNNAQCNESISFAYSGQTAVGLYIGAGLHSQGMLAPVLEDLIKYIEGGDIPGTLFIQLCSGHSSRYAMGVIIDSDEGLSASQAAVREWRDGRCIQSSATSTWKNLTFSVPVQPSHRSNSTSFYALKKSIGRKLLRRETTCTAVQVVSNDTCTTLAAECGITAAELTTYNPSSTLCSTLTVGEYICCTEGSTPDYAPSPDSDDNCYSYMVQEGDTCSTLAATYTITVEDIESYNNDTWGWMGCDDLLANEYICLSSGYPPMPATISNAVCGPQVNGTATVPHGTDMSTLNECPLNACCDIWGQCGITADFCTKTNSTTGAPGTAANGTNGCISNCGTEIIESDAPSEYFKIGYFEGYDVERSCMRTLISEVDTSAYTHIHMSFATLNEDFSFNISTVESQMEDFAALQDVKRIITVGGWSFSTDLSTYDIFRQAVSDASNRATVIENTIAFLEKWDLDGVDWDWEYPGEPDIPDIPADTDEDATYFFIFLLELQEAIESELPGKTISTTAPSSFWYMKAIPIEGISAVVDYIVIMTYDMHGQWDWNNTYADPGCPDGSCLRSHVNLTETLSALSMITKAGVSSNMVAVGVSSYARSFQMTEAGCYGPNCTFTGPDSGAYPGPCTDTAGYISNAELYGIADEWDVYTYIDEDSYSNIMVWNETQWAGYMDDDIKAARLALYENMNFLGTADWAIDLLTDNDSSISDSSACEVYIAPSIWDEENPSVTAMPGCSLIWPPQPLNSTTTINFPPWTHTFSYTTDVTTTTSASGGTDPTTVTSHISYWFPTVLTIPSIHTDAIPVWNVVLPNSTTTGTVLLTSSVEPSPFTVVWTPIIGGTTFIASPTTTATESKTVFIWGEESFTEPALTETLGGSTTVISGTTLDPTTTTVTPVVYPSKVTSTPDPKLNTKTTHWKSGKPPSPTASEGCSGCGTPCKIFCDSDCPICQTYGDDSGEGGSKGESEEEDDNDDEDEDDDDGEDDDGEDDDGEDDDGEDDDDEGDDDEGDDDDDDSETSTSCASTTTKSYCDVFCTVTTSASLPTTSCTSTACIAVSGCDVTATTATITDASTAACATVTDNTFDACQSCPWPDLPFLDSDDADDDEDSSTAAQSYVKRREVNAMITAGITATETVTPTFTTISGPEVTPAPRYGSWGGRKNALEKRKGEDRNKITELGTCVLGDESTATVPTHTKGKVWYTDEEQNLIPETQLDMPRWYWTTVENCVATVYNALPSDDHFEFVGMDLDINRMKGKISKGEWSGTILNELGGQKIKNGKVVTVAGKMLIKASDNWIGTNDDGNNKQNWGARQKFASQKNLLWSLVESCKLVTDSKVFKLMDTTNSRLYNVLAKLDATVENGGSSIAEKFKIFMDTQAEMTLTVQESVKKLVKEMDGTQSNLLATIAAKKASAEQDDESINEANSLIQAYEKLKAQYGITGDDGATACANALGFTYDSTVLKRDTTSAAACTVTFSYSTAAETASATGSPVCVAAQDPDSGEGTYCECSGSDQQFPTLTGSDICGYTAFPTSLVTTATNPYPYTFTDSLGDKIGCASETKKVSDGTTVTACAGASTTLSIDYANNPYPYTFTDIYGVVEACASRSYLEIDASRYTYCAGSRTTEYDPTITVTEVVTTSGLSDLCMGGNYWQCVTDKDLQHMCAGLPRRQMACLNSVIVSAQLACETLCVQVPSTTTMVYTTLAP
ncbi:glycoside hydrolase [Penicillium sp. IBT 35674x]|nr:glycoside hydrolase [Penicillium sp. IBT 35674x]